MNMFDRTMAVLNGEEPDRLPFVTRIDLWYHSRMNTDTMPAEFVGMNHDAPDANQAVKIVKSLYS